VDSLELVERIRSSPGDEAAKEKLYRLVQAAILEKLRAKIPPHLQPRIDAEDVLDMAFLRAIEALDKFQPAGENSFLAWVYRIAKNTIADQGRRHSVAAARFVAGDAKAGPRASAIPSRERRAESLYRKRDWIEAVLSKLKGEEAEVIRLHWLDGQSFEEIAAASGKKTETVRKFYTRSWARFREIAQAKAAQPGERPTL